MTSPVSGSVTGSRRKSTKCSGCFSCAATSAGKCCLSSHSHYLEYLSEYMQIQRICIRHKINWQMMVAFKALHCTKGTLKVCYTKRPPVIKKPDMSVDKCLRHCKLPTRLGVHFTYLIDLLDRAWFSKWFSRWYLTWPGLGWHCQPRPCQP